MTDDQLRALWRSKGGSFHGPHIETGTMPEHQLLPFLRELMRVPRGAVLVTPTLIESNAESAEESLERGAEIGSSTWRNAF